MQTPQGFASEILRKAYEAAYRDGFLGTDDAGLAERIGQTILLTEGDYANIKITTREDLPMEIRVGTGYDVHRLTEGRKLILGGVDIPYEKGLDGHSDADVMAHALMDALLGAAGLGDIGRHFPDTDPQYKGISSLKLLEIVNQRIHEAGYELGNADVTIIAQRPKLAGYISQMEENLAAVLGADIRQINVKATTTEKLGFTGRGEGIAAEAACIIKSKH
ncbi:MAG: 2-C-methyl-D-erythritol 2,4-cyclodiphosphate synthase [Firmicutes bacterium]|nr:2-C-methyl-D-erythritol 2,4-cyclodiphosphate synthase [Bacillota bacterium]